MFGYITEAIRIRRQQDIMPFTVMSCDNLPENGKVTQQAILTYAGALDASHAEWIAANVAFSNSMVDRFTPITTDADRTMVMETFGVRDAWPVVTAPFTQWVLEDRFCNERPAFERVGVQVVEGVAPYELMKLRLLNASHQAMAYIGLLLGYTYVHEAVADEDIEHFLRAYLAEARVTLNGVQGINVSAYIESLFDRFRNPYIADTLARLAVDGSDRIPKLVLPTIRDNIASSRPITMGTAVVASWHRYLETNRSIGDSLAAELIPLSQNRLAFIGYESAFGALSRHTRFVEVVTRLAESLESGSPRRWLQQIGNPTS